MNTRKMQAMWIYLKEHINCRNKVSSAEKYSLIEKRSRSFNSVKDDLEKQLIRRFRKSFSDVCSYKELHSSTFLYELKNGDPTRNIIEMIYKRASKPPTPEITRVLKVKNSTEVIERFEKYRDKVKELLHSHQSPHPRTTVDGNELLRFYGTTMRCSNERSRRVFELCNDPCCRVCRIIQANFDTEYTKKNGIRLSTHSDQLIDEPFCLLKAKTKRAVIVCRIIAGIVGEEHGRCDSFSERHEYSTSESLVVRDSRAVLPCFVIVFT